MVYGKSDKKTIQLSPKEIEKNNKKKLKNLLKKYDEDVKFKIDYKLYNTNLRGANKKYWRNILDNQYVVENVEYGTATIKEVYFIERDGRKKLVPKDSKELMRYIEKARLNNDGDGHSHIINQNQCQQYISNHYKADNHSAIIKAYFKTEPKSRIDAIKISKAQLKDNPVPIAMQRESRILQKLMFDTCYMNESSSGNIYCHAVVDCYSRLCYFDASPIRNAESMLSTLKKAISFFGGIPESVQCDNGGENKNCKMTQYCSENNIKIIYSTPGKPQQNGKIERWNGTFKSDLKNTILNNSEVIQAKDWDHHLGSIRDKLNKTRHSSINMSPYKAHYLKDPELPNMKEPRNFPPEDVAFLEFKDINFNQSEELVKPLPNTTINNSNNVISKDSPLNTTNKMSTNNNNNNNSPSHNVVNSPPPPPPPPQQVVDYHQL
ncbi:hypothetical protein ACTFIW_005538 [Dictyostelium discoideum]